MKISYLVVLGIIIVLLTACSSDDGGDDGGNDPANNQTGVTVTVLSNSQPVEGASVLISPSTPFILNEDQYYRQTVSRFKTDQNGKTSLLSDGFSSQSYIVNALKSGYYFSHATQVAINQNTVKEITIHLTANTAVVDPHVLLYDLDLQYRAAELLIQNHIKYDLATDILPNDLSVYDVIFTGYDLTHYVEFETDFLTEKNRLLQWVTNGGLLVMNAVDDLGWDSGFLPSGNNDISMPSESTPNDFNNVTVHDLSHPLFSALRPVGGELSGWQYVAPYETELRTNLNFDCFDFEPPGIVNPNPNWVKVVTAPHVPTIRDGMVIPANRYVVVAELSMGSGKILLNQLGLYQASYGMESEGTAQQMAQNLMEIIKNPMVLLIH